MSIQTQVKKYAMFLVLLVLVVFFSIASDAFLPNSGKESGRGEVVLYTYRRGVLWLLVLDYRAISGPPRVERAAASLHVLCILTFGFSVCVSSTRFVRTMTY